MTYISAERPRSRGLIRVGSGLVQSAPGDANVEVAEDQLDPDRIISFVLDRFRHQHSRGQQQRCKGDAQD